MSATKRKVLNLEDKVRVIELSKSKSCRKIADKFEMELEDISMKTFLISSKQSQITDFLRLEFLSSELSF